jgi:hypothetical protein
VVRSTSLHSPGTWGFCAGEHIYVFAVVLNPFLTPNIVHRLPPLSVMPMLLSATRRRVSSSLLHVRSLAAVPTILPSERDYEHPTFTPGSPIAGTHSDLNRYLHRQRYWEHIPQWAGVSHEDFLDHRWQVSLRRSTGK